MVRIQDSQSWHRGSIPLSTTKVFIIFFDGDFFCLNPWWFASFVLSLQYEKNDFNI